MEKEYGLHQFSVPRGYHDFQERYFCKYGCGCWIGGLGHGGPPGLDPNGACPNNPKDGHCERGNFDYANVVEQRIQQLKTRAEEAERKLRRYTSEQQVPSSHSVEATLVGPVHNESLSIRLFLKSDHPSYPEIVEAFKKRNRAVLRIQADVLDKKANNS
jgi:hypothetical protein